MKGSRGEAAPQGAAVHGGRRRPTPEVHRVDGLEKVRGLTRYLADLKIPGMLHGKTVRAPIASGRLRGLKRSADFDWSDIAVVTPADIPGRNAIAMIRSDMPCLAHDEIRYLGEPVALVAAADPGRAAAAAAAMVVEAEASPAVMGIHELARRRREAPDSPTTIAEYRIDHGDITAGFAAAAFVHEGEYVTGPQEHAYLEPQGMLAIPDGAAMRLIGSLQCPYYVRPAVAGVLGVGDEQVIVEQSPIGGAFGGKEDFPSLLGAHAALLATKSGRPVRMLLDRCEDMRFTTKRHASWVRLRTGHAADGSLTAIEGEILFDGGAYTTLTPVVLARGVLHAAGVYRCPNVRLHARAAASNTPPAGAFRGFGAPQTHFAIESHLDEAALRLGLSPLAVRRRNIYRRGDVTATGQTLRESVGGRACLEAVARDCEFGKRRRRIERSNAADPGVRRGLGLAAMWHGAGFTGSGERKIAPVAALELQRDGAVVIRVANTEMGQGSLTALSLLTAEALRLPLSRIIHPLANTALAPNSGPTVASRTTMIVGRILQDAARELERRLGAALGPNASRAGEGFALAGGRRVSWPQAARLAVGDEPLRVEASYPFPDNVHWDDDRFCGDAYLTFSWGATAIELAIDLATLVVTPREIWLAYDIGRAVHRQQAEGQLEGGTIQALGYGLFERVDLKDGHWAQDRLQTYIVPTAADAPKLHTQIVEQPFSLGPGGAKGLGELPMNGLAAAIANAVRHALGVRVTEIPITPERLLAALKGAGRA